MRYCNCKNPNNYSIGDRTPFCFNCGNQIKLPNSKSVVEKKE